MPVIQAVILAHDGRAGRDNSHRWVSHAPTGGPAKHGNMGERKRKREERSITVAWSVSKNNRGDRLL